MAKTKYEKEYECCREILGNTYSNCSDERIEQLMEMGAAKNRRAQRIARKSAEKRAHRADCYD